MKTFCSYLIDNIIKICCFYVFITYRNHNTEIKFSHSKTNTPITNKHTDTLKIKISSPPFNYINIKK